MKGSGFIYKFGTKNNWRRWAWNRIAERTEDPKNALCIYLPSSDDRDRPIALSKGFSAHNLIGVERDKRALESARTSGLVVDGDFKSAVRSTLSRRSFDVIFGDFCSSFDFSFVDEAIAWMLLGNGNRTTYCFNFMRGRDQKINPLRAFSAQYLQYEEKHRGRLFFLSVFVGLRIRCDHGKIQPWISNIAANSEDVPSFHSYKSTSGQIFDSVVMHSPFRGRVQCIPEKQVFDPFIDRRVDNSFRAILAHRTMALRKSNE